MTIKHRSQLGDLMKELNLPLQIVELGVAQGLYAKEMMDWSTQVLYLIDKWETSGIIGDGAFAQEWHDNNLLQVRDRMEQYDNRPEKYVILQGDTSEMAQYIPDNSLGMVYIDADHSYEGVTKDIENYYPKLVTGGIVALHDFMNIQDYGVNTATYDWCDKNGYTRQEVNIIPENDIMDAGAYFIKH